MKFKTVLFATLLSAAITTPAFANKHNGGGISFDNSGGVSINLALGLKQLLRNDGHRDQHRDKSYRRDHYQQNRGAKIDKARLKQRRYHQQRTEQNARLRHEEQRRHQARLQHEEHLRHKAYLQHKARRHHEERAHHNTRRHGRDYR